MSNSTASSFVEFCRSHREEVRAANPSATFKDMGKILLARWNELNQSKKTAPATAPAHVIAPEENNAELRRSSRLRNKRLGLNFWGCKINK